jgi:NCS1 family nucleobase:cation symporter-1
MSDPTQKQQRLEEQGLSVERHSIDHIPHHERHGRVHSLFTVWFGGNMQITTIVTGALGVILGLDLPWALVALLLGNLFGAIFMALHSAQGPKLGIPQMIQSRAQFGFMGAVVPIFLVVLMYIGFFASGVVLGGEALAAWWGIGFVPAALILSVISTLFTVYGYWAIHRLERFVSIVTAVAFVYLSWRLFELPGAASAWHAGPLAFGPFLLVIAIAATWQITYAPYVADYSRYLPHDTSITAAFWWSYAGTVIASAWMMAIGAAAAALARGTFDQGSSEFIVNLAPPGLRWAVSIVLILGIVATDVLNQYGMFMSSATIITAFRPLKMGQRMRAVFVTVASVIGTAVGILGQGDFVTNLEDFILFLAYFLIPWTAINLADFYVVRKEQYHLPSIFSKDGIYGWVNWRTMIAYVVSVVAEIPFMSTTFYTGPAVKLMGGADIAWIIGLVLAAGLYVVLMRPVMSDVAIAGLPAEEGAAV